MSVTVVPVTESHVEGFHACLDAVAREERFLAQVAAPPLERVRAFVLENISCGAAQFVAVDGVSVVGWCDVLPKWAEAVKHCGALGMGLLPAYRGRGIGQELIAACLARARTNGITRVELEARADNERAIGLYRKMGFVHEAVKRNGMRFGGRYFDAVQMSLILEGGA